MCPAFLYAERQIPLLFIVRFDKVSIGSLQHRLDLPRKRRIGKIIRSGHCINKEVFRTIPGFRDNLTHKISVRGKTSTHGHKIIKIIQTILKSMPGCHRSHGESTKSPMHPRGRNPLRRRILRIRTVPSLHRRNQIIDQLIMIIIRQPKRQTVTGTVLRARVVVSRADNDHRLHPSILNGMIDHMLQGSCLLIRRSIITFRNLLQRFRN